MFIYPENLKAKPKLWLWQLRDISIIGICMILSALAVCFLAGLRVTEPDMKNSVDQYLDAQRLMDLRVVSTLGLTEEDVEVLSRQEGVELAQGTRR